MKKTFKKSLASILFILTFALVFTLFPAEQTQAATKITHKFGGVDYLLTKGKTVTIKNSYVVKWKSENSKIAAVNSKGKVVAKSGGVATIIGTTQSGSTFSYDVGVKTSTFIPAYKTPYKVGKDIAAGTYVVIHDKKTTSSGSFTYWGIKTKKKNGKTLNNDGFSYTSIVSIKKGQYFEINGGYAVPLKKASKSLFTVKNLNKYTAGSSYSAAAKVGYGFPAGTYKFTLSKGNTYGRIEILKSPKNNTYSYDKLIDSASVSEAKKSVTLTLKKGQYLFFEGCTLKKVN